MASSAAVSGSSPQIAHGTFTSAASKAAEVITIGWDPDGILFVIDQEAVSPDIVLSFNGATSSSFITGTTGVITSPANEVTYTGNGTITLSDTPQNNDGVNYYFAWKLT
jgi:hypothetical protein